MCNRKMPYAKQIRLRMILWWCVIVFLLAWMVFVGETGGDSRMMTDLAEKMGRILYFGGMIFAACRIRHNKKLLADRLLLKEQALRERDEYSRALHLHSGGMAMDIMLLALYLLTMTAAFYSMPVFYTGYWLLVMAAAVKGGLWLVCRRGWIRM